MIALFSHRKRLARLESALSLRKAEAELLMRDVAALEAEVDGLRSSMGLEPRRPINPTAEG